MSETKVARGDGTRRLLKDLPYNPDVNPETFATAKAWLEARKDEPRTGNATYAKLWDAPEAGGPGRQEDYIDAICHASMALAAPGVALIASVIKNPVLEDEPYRARWYEWLYNESPYRHFILSDLDLAANGGIILSSDMPAPVLQNILILTRHGWEISRPIYDLWVDCLNNGIPGWLAYATLMNTKASFSGYGGSVPVEFSLDDFYSPHTQQHRAHWTMNLPTLTNFRHEIVGKWPFSYSPVVSNVRLPTQLSDPKASYRTNSNFYGGYCIFDDTRRDYTSANYTNDLLEQEDFRELLKGRRAAVRAKVPDPFSQSNQMPPNGGGMTYRDVVEVAMPYVLERGLTDLPEASQTTSAADKTGADDAIPPRAIGAALQETRAA